jgi:hypothetical protein
VASSDLAPIAAADVLDKAAANIISSPLEFTAEQVAAARRFHIAVVNVRRMIDARRP